jgi:predicted AlkP superfamily phosphohydrolase/phosphomutase
LEQHGYLTWSGNAAVESEESHELGEAHPYHLTHLDLSKTRAYATSASSNGIHIAVRGVRGDGGVAPEEYAAFREELIDALLTECVDPATGEPLVTQVWTREQAFAGPRMDDAPDVTVALRDSGFFSVLRAGAVLKPRTVVMGCHHPDGILIGHGPGVRVTRQLATTTLLDMTPTMLYLLGLPLPQDLEGTVVGDMFTEEYRRAHPVIHGDRTRWPMGDGTVDRPEVGPDTESEAQVLMRLRALGYIE